MEEKEEKYDECGRRLKDDPVNHPKHYTMGTIEVITVIEDWNLGFHLGNAVKYIARCRHKGSEIQDIEKAILYLTWYKNKREREMG